MQHITSQLKYYEHTFDIRDTEAREERLKEWKKNWRREQDGHRMLQHAETLLASDPAL